MDKEGGKLSTNYKKAPDCTLIFVKAKAIDVENNGAENRIIYSTQW